MKRITFFAGVFLTACLIFSCESNSTEPKSSQGNVPQEMVGTWHAAQYIMTDKSNPLNQVDLISFGLQVTLIIQNSGHYQSNMIIPGDTTYVDTGMLSLSGTQLTVDSDSEAPTTMTCEMSGNHMTLTDPNSEFDFNDDGTDEPATATVVLIKSSGSKK